MVADSGSSPQLVAWQTQLVSKRVLIAVALAAIVALELQTSWLQSKLFSAVAQRMTFSVAPGPSPTIRYPRAAPYDSRLGYANLPGFLARLQDNGFAVDAQARPSRLLVKLMDWGVFPIYREKSRAGLHILDRSGRPLFSTPYPARTYGSFDDIPLVIWKTLLFIENRELVDSTYPYRNPALEWDRLANAVFDLGVNTVDPGHPVSGGSTLATQLEKIRHSPGGRTGSVREKLTQMLAASLRAYQDGMETMESRKRIVRDYIDSMPLAAISGYGEITGLGDGLWAWFGAEFEAVNRLLSNEKSQQDASLRSRARAYRQVLSLLLAVNRPSYYLREAQGELQTRADGYLKLLAEAGIISPRLRDLALRESLDLRTRARIPAAGSFVERKATNRIRAELLELLGVDQLYDLDRLDLTVSTSLTRSGPKNPSLARSRRLPRNSQIVEAAGLSFRLSGSVLRERHRQLGRSPGRPRRASGNYPQ